MKLFYLSEHTSCVNYVSDIQMGFKLTSLPKSEVVEGKSVKHNTIVFILSGEIELSCNEFFNKKLTKGKIIFLAQGSDVTGRAIKETELLVFIFSSQNISVCDKCTLNSYLKSSRNNTYEFASLKQKGPIKAFLELMKTYLVTGINCMHLHEIKQKELFILFRAIYTKKELVNFFHPIIGLDLDFKTKILERYHLGYTISEFASELAMTPSSFANKFNKEFGITYHQWMLKQKAKHIKHKLMLHSTTITDIVNEFNFSSASHFTKYCKAQFGCTPIELIKSLRHPTLKT